MRKIKVQLLQTLNGLPGGVPATTCSFSGVPWGVFWEPFGAMKLS